MFQPEISIGDSSIHAGRKVWVWHLPGGVVEKYGIIPDVSPERCRYIAALKKRFDCNVRLTEVTMPDLTIGLADNGICGCGRPRGIHHGNCKFRREQAQARFTAAVAVVGTPMPVTVTLHAPGPTGELEPMTVRATRDIVHEVDQLAEQQAATAVATPATWEKCLLDKFPDFNPAWPDKVQIEWFRGFALLMGVKP